MSPTSKSTVRVLILSDGKPGHITFSLGVLAGIEKLAVVQPVTVRIRLRVKMFRHLLCGLVNHPQLLDRIPKPVQRGLIRFFYWIDDARLLTATGAFDWLISAGGDTAVLNAWLARLLGLRNIYCSQLRGLSPEQLTLVLSPVAMPGIVNAIRLRHAPVPIERAQLDVLGHAFRAAHQLGTARLWAVLIGGDGAGYRYDRSTMECMVRGLLALAERYDARLLVTTSRRTGIKLERIVQAGLDRQPSVAYAVYFNQRPEKVVARFLGAAEHVFCTEDSGAMITESIAAGKPVHVLAPDAIKPQAYYEAGLRQFIEARQIRRIPIRALAAADMGPATAAFFSILPQDSVTELAAQLKPWFEAGRMKRPPCRDEDAPVSGHGYPTTPP